MLMDIYRPLIELEFINIGDLACPHPEALNWYAFIRAKRRLSLGIFKRF